VLAAGRLAAASAAARMALISAGPVHSRPHIHLGGICRGKGKMTAGCEKGRNESETEEAPSPAQDLGLAPEPASNAEPRLSAWRTAACGR
jgi:hypothetical protein